MTAPTVSLQSLHLEYKLWIAELNFDVEMIRIFEAHLEKIASVNKNNKEVLSKVEHFQNQFIRQREVIDELKHDLHTSEVQLAAFTQEMSTVGYDSERMDNHSGLRERFLTFRKIFSDLKYEFHSFEGGVI
ncbi:MAG TPA: hypothetical protein VG676_14930 [Chitinophagaceae bacterium]|jgi:hypothetical protein|nr:hypothetical protein [Chitinophagaceae bacterium]